MRKTDAEIIAFLDENIAGSDDQDFIRVARFADGTVDLYERKALTEAELSALHDKLGGRPVVATYNESKRRGDK